MSVGCFSGGGNACWTDAFVETLTSQQCSSWASAFSMSASIFCGYGLISSSTSMTIEICLHICNSNGFVYAGLCA